MAVVILSDLRLLAHSATLGAAVDFPAPSLWKGVLRLAVLGDFIRHQIDFQRLVGKHNHHSAHQLLFTLRRSAASASAICFRC